ncbi:MAG TPA: HAD-IC family P-type ATPase [Acidimicrobiales bacterium]|nr:HAD-IC family P-type ATPase [Acidimicrobiales bacterium]
MQQARREDSPAAADAAPSRQGLTEEEAAARLAARQDDDVPRTGRTVADILRANILTRFNGLLGALFVAVLVVGPPQDALFGLVMVANSAIGIAQELRAKRTLDRFRVVSTPVATVVRSGQARSVPVSEIVVDDLVEVGAGEQIVVDGTVVGSNGLEADESLLTGESHPVTKHEGDEVLSGSSVVAGRGVYVATRVGSQSYANTLAAAARQFSLVHSEIRAGIDRILRWVTWALVPTAVLLFASQLSGQPTTADAVRGAVAGVVAMVPEGLVLLTSLAFALGVVRLGRHKVLVQQLPAIEVLARVDVVCADKTGTLTEGGLRVTEVVALTPDRELPVTALAALARVDPSPNTTAKAIAEAFSEVPDWTPESSVPFSSGRRWSGASFGVLGTWVIGAPDVLLGAAADGQVRTLVDWYTGRGQRVVVLARGRQLDGHELPRDLQSVALVVLHQKIRPDAAATVRYFANQGVTVKVLSGDHPRTVGTVAEGVGIPTGAGPVDARHLPEDGGELADLVEQRHAFGRVGPDTKQAIVQALQARGHVVAMVGDGVNDVRALKSADIGLAMGSGTQAARSVSELVLMNDSFSGLPHVVREGRRVMGNVERVANLFVTKTTYALLLALAIGVATLPFPLLPRQLTLVGSLTIGIPSFFLAFSRRAPRARPGFVPRVLAFAVPAGICAAGATFVAYALGRLAPDVNLDESRTIATMVLLGVGLSLLARLARPLTWARRGLILGLAAAYLLALVVPAASEFFLLNVPPPIVTLAAFGSASIAMWVFDFVVSTQEVWMRWLRAWGSRLSRSRPPVPGRTGGKAGP